MGALEDLAQAYIASTSGGDALIAASDPYLAFQQAPNLALERTMQAANTGKFKNRDLIVSALLSGLTSGIAGGLSDDYQGRAKTAYSDVIRSSLVGDEVEKPSVLSTKVYNQAKNVADTLAAQQLFAQAQRRNERADKLEDTINNQIAQNPYEAAAIREALKPGSTTSVIDVSERKIKDPKEYLSESNKLRTELTGRQEVKDAVNTGRLYETLQGMLDNPSALADLPFIVGFVKAGDPTSTVRESESGAVIESSSLPTAITSKLNKYLSGEGSKVTRGELFKLIGGYYKGYKSNADKLIGQYEGIANRRGIKKEDAIALPSLPELMEQAAPITASPDAIKAELIKRGLLK